MPVINYDNFKMQSVVYAPLADIQATELAGQLQVGVLHKTSDQTEVQSGYAVTASKIDWNASKAYVDAKVLTEKNRAEGAESQLNQAILDEEAARIQAISDEVTARNLAIGVEKTRAEGAESQLNQAILDEEAARIQGDQDLQNAITQEVTDRQTAVSNEATARGTAISNLETSLTSALTTAIDSLKDASVRDVFGITYEDQDSTDLSDLMPSSIDDGVYALLFRSASVDAAMTVTGLPQSELGTGDITYGDVLRVTVNGGVVTAAKKVDDVTKAKFAALDTAITDLQNATTATAIRSHFSAGSVIAIDGNGMISFKRSANLINDLLLDGTGAAYVNVYGTVKNIYGHEQDLEKHIGDLYDAVAAGAFDAENGVTKVGDKVKLGGALTGATEISGTDTLTVSAPMQVEILRMPVYNIDANGNRTTKSNVLKEIWIDGNSLNIVSVPN